MRPKDVAGMTNSVDPDQSALSGAIGAVWSGSALIVHAYLPQNLGSWHDITCSPTLLVEVLHGFTERVMYHKSHIWFIYPHTKGHSCHNNL